MPKNNTRKYESPLWYLIPITISTIVIAVSTIVSVVQTNNTLGQMEKQTQLTDSTIVQQARYFHTINRPFVYIYKIGVISSVAEKDTLLQFKFYYKNVGTIPAKIMFNTSGFSNMDIKTFDFTSESEGPLAHVYPSQEGSITRNKKISLSLLRKNPYLRVWLNYGDMNSTRYDYKHIEYYYDIVPLSSNEINFYGNVIWSEAN